SDYTLVKNITKEIVLTTKGDIAILMPWVWLYGIDHGVEVLFTLMNKIKNIFQDLHNESDDDGYSYMDGVILIGHSAGGLVASLYNYRYNVLPILRLITIGTPFYGTKKAFNLLQLNTQSTDMRWYTYAQTIALANNPKFPIIYDLLPKLDAHNQIHLNQQKVDRSNAMKDEIQMALKHDSQSIYPVKKIYIYNVKHMLRRQQEKQNKTHLGSLTYNGNLLEYPIPDTNNFIYPIFSDGVVDSTIVKEPHSITYHIKTNKSHKFLLNDTKLNEGILRRLIR
ncbi:MAG: hypothetical protein ACRYGG_00230, partial [Janthinobacterium lividum]